MPVRDKQTLQAEIEKALNRNRTAAARSDFSIGANSENPAYLAANAAKSSANHKSV